MHYFSTSSLIGLGLLLGLLWACGTPAPEQPLAKAPPTPVKLFKLLSPERTGITFENQIMENEYNNVDLYDYMYNGAGVAAGDINNDGLMDLFFTGNMVHNKLYLNKGDMVFEDITEAANLILGDGWCTGVTMADVNADGFMDIYVGRAYYEKEDLRENLLYINNGDLTFTERGAEYGLNDNSYTTHATFFDYDLDGDLDLYVVNHPIDFGPPSDAKHKKLHNPSDIERDKLFRNDGDNKFTEVGKQAGINDYGFGLSATVGDLNQDGWPDVYVANDYEEPDVLYQNNGDGTFSNVTKAAMKHLSFYGMGADIADFNNDGLLDVLVMDMLAADNYRQKTNMRSMAPAQFWDLISKGYHYQYMRNTLQLNNGDGSFSEIGQLSGITKTDWSWATLFADFDNDGHKDIFTANGYRRDVRNIDGLLAADEAVVRAGGKLNLKEMMDVILSMPSKKISNYYFRNKGDLTFEEVSSEMGLSEPSFSSGAIYADLDNDGDLDLVINNLLTYAFVYENQLEKRDKVHWLRVALKGDDKNKQGLGAKVTVRTAAGIQFQELTLSRGFQSSVEPILHFGLGAEENVIEVVVKWPDGREQTITSPPADKLLSLLQTESTESEATPTEIETYFTELKKTGVDFKHVENKYKDYDKEILLPHRMSQFGPALAVGDVNADGLDDFYVGGAKDQAGQLYTQTASGNFKALANPVLARDKACEDVAAAFMDVDGDKDLDLYVVSGGSEFDPQAPELQDRLYINDGRGNYKRGELPEMLSSGGCIAPGDFDADGDIDIFVGGRLHPGHYPLPGVSYLLRNNEGSFEDVTAELAPDVSEIGMVSSAIWSDHDSDGQLDLVMVGEWMPITVFKQTEGHFDNQDIGLGHVTGWWNSIVAKDLDGDGDDDYIAGNLGLNYKFHASEKEPLHVYAHDFDNSGTLDIVLGYYNSGTCYPVRGRQCSSQQMPNIAKEFPSYHDFGKASLFDVYGDRLNDAIHYQATHFASSVVMNKGGGKFEITELPIEAQFSTIFGIIPEDFNADGIPDLLLAGNFYVSEVETGRADASVGLYLTGDGKGNFKPLSIRESGFNAGGDVRNLKVLNAGDGARYVLVANNNDYLKIFKATRISRGQSREPINLKVIFLP